jgi:dTDP-glucose pyrophosphorylase
MINILIPMAGGGSKFAEKGYTFPKPLIEINGKPTIEWVIKNLTPNVEHNFIFIVKREHYEKYKLGSMLGLIAPNCKIIIIDAPTQGAACTALFAKEYINGRDPLVIAGSDQYVLGGVDGFLDYAREQALDGVIMTFKSAHPKWSFAKLGKDGLVMETAEKNPISDNASVGIYFFKQGSDFVLAAENMIKKDIRTNGEFFLAPVYNELILQDKKIGIYEIEQKNMISWATPEDLELFLKSQVELKA